MEQASPQTVLDWLQTGSNGPLVVVLLLLGWLWLLVRRRPGDEGVQRRLRPSPLNDEELGRVAFRALLSRDTGLWRDLFVNGAEARSLLDDRAQDFLEDRPPELLDGVLDHLSEGVPIGATYSGVEVSEDGQRAVRVKLPNGGEHLVSLGHAVQIGAALRLWGGLPD